MTKLLFKFHRFLIHSIIITMIKHYFNKTYIYTNDQLISVSGLGKFRHNTGINNRKNEWKIIDFTVRFS